MREKKKKFTRIDWVTCLYCGNHYARSPGKPDVFCRENCRDSFVERRAVMGICAHPECRRPITQLHHRVRRKYCSDTCCSKSYYDRTGGFMLRRMGDRRGCPHGEEAIAAKAEQIQRDRARSRTEYRKRQEFDPNAPTPKPLAPPPPRHVPQSTYVPGLIAFAVMYGYQATGATVLASCPVSEARAVHRRNYPGAP